MANNRTKPETWNRIFSYVGRPTNSLGDDGDYYIDERTNLLHGPKATGAWPENGSPVHSVCKRSTVELSVVLSPRVRQQKKSFTWDGRMLSQWRNKLRRSFVRSRAPERRLLMSRENSHS
jgi:hypothetical protein